MYKIDINEAFFYQEFNMHGQWWSTNSFVYPTVYSVCVCVVRPARLWLLSGLRFPGRRSVERIWHVFFCHSFPLTILIPTPVGLGQTLHMNLILETALPMGMPCAEDPRAGTAASCVRCPCPPKKSEPFRIDSVAGFVWEYGRPLKDVAFFLQFIICPPWNCHKLPLAIHQFSGILTHSFRQGMQSLGCSRDNLRWFSVELSPLIADYHVHGTKLSSEINNLNGELSLLPQFSWFNFLRFG